MPQSFLKDPQAVLEYMIDWSDWLVADADTISTSTWAADTGITIMSSAGHLPTNTTTTATVWLSGGTVGAHYSVTNTIVTSAGRTDERTIVLIVEQR